MNDPSRDWNDQLGIFIAIGSGTGMVIGLAIAAGPGLALGAAAFGVIGLILLRAAIRFSRSLDRSARLGHVLRPSSVA